MLNIHFWVMVLKSIVLSSMLKLLKQDQRIYFTLIKDSDLLKMLRSHVIKACGSSALHYMHHILYNGQSCTDIDYVMQIMYVCMQPSIMRWIGHALHRMIYHSEIPCHEENLIISARLNFHVTDLYHLAYTQEGWTRTNKQGMP